MRRRWPQRSGRSGCRPIVLRSTECRSMMTTSSCSTTIDRSPGRRAGAWRCWSMGWRAATAAPYMRRIAGRLNRRGVRTFRMDLRGCGAGMLLRGCPTTAAIRRTLRWHWKRSRGFVRVRRAQRSGSRWGRTSSSSCLVSAAIGRREDWQAASPSAHRSICWRAPSACRRGRIAFTIATLCRSCWHGWRRRRRLLPDAPALALACRPRTLYELDEPVHRAQSGDSGRPRPTTRAASSGRFVPSIRLPTLILAARDDPLIPVESLEGMSLSPAVTRHITDHGGHLGFIGRRSGDPDRCWLDWRIVEHVAS